MELIADIERRSSSKPSRKVVFGRIKRQNRYLKKRKRAYLLARNQSFHNGRPS